MNRFKIILPIAVLISAVIISIVLVKSDSKPHYKQHAPTATSVEVIKLEKNDFQVWVKSQGTVSPRTESTLIAEISGRISSISPAFREGAFFEAGQQLLQVDPSNYRLAITVAQSQVAQMQLAVAEEQAKARQAAKNWQRLGQGQQPSELVLRKPQLASAKASLAAAEALLKQARLDQQRTRIVAPYAGRVLEQQVDVGQFVSPGTILAKIYAVDYAEIRLPLSNEQLQFIDIPDLYRGQDQQSLNMPEVTLIATMGLQVHQWQGRIVRAEGAYDTRSRRLSLVAQVDDPYAKTSDNKPALKVGQFVEANIKGKLLQNVFVIPRNAIKDSNQLMIVNQQSQLTIRQVEIIWRDADYVVIQNGLQEGEWLSITPIQYAVNGLSVKALHQGISIIHY
ncbi:MAG: efflux RND transporter periplasmic adaptor subunit [Methylococcales symbiont of Iophon sp. n. MRB-2018]|nr:MAG: efflux RND transporter periplasmic adaptor subunit [Methylococcales symbiont of Iophon sp. n. MRB-2018]KAF3979345.1 MAG: efflux RND transporter periplasmic adaptor subunit [Methylococcales symbiont of Iophon sp. n. MRB-2018]